MKSHKEVRLDQVAKIDISGVDKKIKDDEARVKLCNFTDVYKNWSINTDMISTLMDGSANKSEIERFSLKKGMVAITKDSETRDDIGIPCFVSNDLPNTVLGYHAALIIPDETKLDGGYLNGYLHSKRAKEYFYNQASGSGQRYTLTIGGIGAIKLELPNIEDQKKVARLLAEIDEKISVNKKINDNLYQQIQTIFDYWFTQYDFPNADGQPYHSSGCDLSYDSLTGQHIPSKWTSCSLGSLCTFGNGINYDKNEIGDKTYKIVNVRNITSSTLFINSSELDEISLKSLQADKYLINEGDILIARSGTPGAVRLIDRIDNTIYCGFIIHCLPLNPSLRNYLTFVLKKLEGSNATKTGGSILQNVSQDTLKNLLVVIPDNSVIDAFNTICDQIFAQVNAIMDQNNMLLSLRDWLLPMLMNGQVTIVD